MAKLVYIDLPISSLKNSGAFREDYSSNGLYYNSLVFTNDGHLVTHGKDYSIASPITSVSAIAGGSAGNILYLSELNITSFISTPENNGNYIITYNNSVPSLTSFSGYKLRLNLESNNSNWTSISGTSILGSTGIYAPTSSGSANLILISNGPNSSPTWKSLTTISSNDSYNIPTLDKVEELISSTVTSLFSWKGDATVTSGTLTIPSNPEVGYAYRIPSETTLSSANSAKGSNETLEAGDIIICTNTTGPTFATLNTNWTISKSVGSVIIGTEATVFNVGGVDLKLTVNAPSSWKTTDTWREIYYNNGGTVTELFNAGSTKGLYLEAGNNVSISKGTSGTNYEVLTISATNTNTWREVDVYKIVSSELDGNIDTLLSASTGTNPLKFSNNFSVNSNNEIDLIWEEISSSGTKTYHV